MPARGMTPAERLVGRRLPAPPRHLDTVLASFVKEDDTFCGRIEPSERWLRAPHLKARRTGLIKHSGMGFKFEGDRTPGGLYYLTPKGEPLALAAKARIAAIEAARRDWARAHSEAIRQARRPT